MLDVKNTYREDGSLIQRITRNGVDEEMRFDGLTSERTTGNEMVPPTLNFKEAEEPECPDCPQTKKDGLVFNRNQGEDEDMITPEMDLVTGSAFDPKVQEAAQVRNARPRKPQTPSYLTDPADDWDDANIATDRGGDDE